MANTKVGRDLLAIPQNGLPVVYIAKNEVRYFLGLKDCQYEYMSDFRVGARWANAIRSRFSAFRSAAKYFEVSDWEQAGKTMFRHDDSRVLGLTLTTYPDAHTETTSVDGFTLANSVTTGGGYAGCNSAASAGTVDDSGTLGKAGQNYFSGNTSFNIWRSNILFDTSALTASATISAATMSLYGDAASTDTLGVTPELHIYSSAPAANTSLTGADYDRTKFGSTSFGSVAWASWSTSAYNDITLNASGIANISLTAVSKFGARTNRDVAETSPSTGSTNQERFEWASADTADTTSDPKLVVTYTLPSTFIPKIIIT